MANIVSMQFATYALNELCSSPVPLLLVSTNEQTEWMNSEKASNENQ